MDEIFDYFIVKDNFKFLKDDLLSKRTSSYSYCFKPCLVYIVSLDWVVYSYPHSGFRTKTSIKFYSEMDEHLPGDITFSKVISCFCVGTSEIKPNGDHSLPLMVGFQDGTIVFVDCLSDHTITFNNDKLISPNPVDRIEFFPMENSGFIATFGGSEIYLFHTSFREETESIFVDYLENDRGVVWQNRSLSNPSCVLRYGTSKVTDFKFSGNSRYLAMCDEEGKLSVIHWDSKEIKFECHSQFGSILCISWSHDSKLLLAGGQDDSIVVIDTEHWRIIARCIGHKSWVNGISFDVWESKKEEYRFSSAGEDGNIVIWELNMDTVKQFYENRVKETREIYIIEPEVTMQEFQVPATNVTITPNKLIATSWFSNITLWTKLKK
eukprot:TRINITY_DN4045_c0_g1_i2.p1 TRINITY_DN4045_c0_g1~~TRINITY_DN4045_c0_g1_i2.p1  ORF type:complete len:380 (-),score=53.62 TRINITY_DN4045_c0_g1_i2:158-1297(-)